MTIFAWYDIPVALVVGLCAVLADQSWQRGRRKSEHRTAVMLDRASRTPEEIIANVYWHVLRHSEGALAELFAEIKEIDAHIAAMLAGTAPRDQPAAIPDLPELHSVHARHLERVI